MAGAALIVLWWLFFSRAPWSERLGVVALMAVAVYLSMFIVHPSIRGGMMGMMVPLVLGLPGMALALVVWAAATRRLARGPRLAALVAIVVAMCGLFASIRTDGLLGGKSQFAWRWTPTAEERLLAQAQEMPAAAAPPAPAPSPRRTESRRQRAEALPSQPADAPAAPAAPATTEPASHASRMARLPRRRAQQRRSRRSDRDRLGARRRPSRSGAGRSDPAGRRSRSPAIVSSRRSSAASTRSSSCYSATTGKPVWMHKDTARFYESNGGAGPRGTPTFSDGRVYALGATGILNALDAGNGAVVWTRDTVRRYRHQGARLGHHQFTAGGRRPGRRRRLGRDRAYDRASGDRRWFVKSTGGSYSSPHLSRRRCSADPAATPDLVSPASLPLTARCSGHSNGAALPSSNRRCCRTATSC